MSNDYESNWNPTNNKPKTKRKRLEEIEFLLHFQTPTSRNKKRLTTLWLYMHNIYIHIYIYRIVPDSICHDNTTNECRMQFSAKNLFCPMTFTFIPACLHIQHTLCTYYSFCSVACNLELRQSATRESCLGLGRNGNRNRMGDGSGSGSGWGAASGRVKVAAKTKAKVMTFWQPSRKCLV